MFCRIRMAHKQGKQKALELFAKGLHPPDVSASLGIHIRNVQRWFKEFTNQKNGANSPEENIGKVVTAGLEEYAYVPSSEDEDDRNLTPWISKKWLNAANALSTDHYRAHLDVRQRIETILIEKLQESDLNLRSVHVLSLALTRHIDGERTATSLDLIDVNRAAKVVESHGLSVIDPTYTQENC